MELNKNADGYFRKHVLLSCLNSLNKCFPGRSVVKNLPANAEDSGSISGSGRPPGGGHGNPLQYSGLENPMDRGAWWATVHAVAESDMTYHSALLYLFISIYNVLVEGKGSFFPLLTLHHLTINS